MTGFGFPWGTIWEVVKTIGGIGLFVFAAVQLWLQRREHLANQREHLARQRAAFGVVYADFVRLLAKQADWHGQVDRGNERRNANRVLVSGIDLSVQRRCATPAEPLPSASSPLLCFSVVIPFAPSPPFRRHRLSYGALMKVGTRSGRITSCVPITDIV